MYDNIASKIKALAQISFAIVAIASIVLGIALLNGTYGWSLVIVVVGPLMAWISSLFLYGFGELIERTASIDAKLQSQKKRDSLIKNDTKETKDEDFASVQPKKAFMNVADNAPKKMCPHCGEWISKNICDMCGEKNNLFSK
jgi:hypothetical protein